jgi:hypothetical protein
MLAWDVERWMFAAMSWFALSCCACATTGGTPVASQATVARADVPQKAGMEGEFELCQVEVLGDAEQREREEVAAAKAHEEEEVAWQRADAPGCANPRTVDACRGLSLFVARYPSSSDVEEARRILEASAPKIALLEDEAAWKAAHPGLCRPRVVERRVVESTCWGVRNYLSHFPNGIHAKEARLRYDQWVAALEKYEKPRRDREIRRWVDAQNATPP